MAALACLRTLMHTSKTKKMVKVLALVGAFGLSSVASANGSVSNALVTSIYINLQLGSLAFVTVNTTKTNNPSCSASNQFVLQLGSSIQNQFLALLLTARTAQTPVSLIGEGTCSAYGGVEDLIVVTY
jgi:hypothetical protein